MSARNQVIAVDSKLDLRSILRADDMLISMGDLSFGGSAIGPFAQNNSYHFAISILSLSHILTRIVLSDRLVFIDNPEPDSPENATWYLCPEVLRHCNTIQIYQGFAPVSGVIAATAEDPEAVLGADLVWEMRSFVSRFVPWADTSLSTAWLCEYAVSKAIDAPFAPNPVLSEALGVNSLRGRLTTDQLLHYVEDLRRETSMAMNMLKGLEIYDLQVPAIFAAVLRESRDGSDMVRVAAQMNSEAKAFRSWCKNLDAMETSNPKKYLEQFNVAMDALRRLGKSLGTGEVERMQVSMPTPFGIGIDLPSSTLKKLVDFFDVNVTFVRPRSFLLNLLSSARQVVKLSDEIARVLDRDKEFAQEAARHLTALASGQR